MSNHANNWPDVDEMRVGALGDFAKILSVIVVENGEDRKFYTHDGKLLGIYRDSVPPPYLDRKDQLLRNLRVIIVACRPWNVSMNTNTAKAITTALESGGKYIGRAVIERVDGVPIMIDDSLPDERMRVEQEPGASRAIPDI